MHSSLAITPEGLPLGLTAARFWSRSKFKGTTALKRHINPTRVPIEAKESIRWLDNMSQSNALIGEPARCIHIGGRENDIYEFFCRAVAEGTNFLVRTSLASYKVPRRVLFFTADELELTGSAKIKTADLRSLAAETMAREHSS